MAIIVGASGTGTEAKSDRMGIPTGTSDPASASAGDMYYHTTDKKIKIYDGTDWTELGSGGGEAAITYATNGLLFDLDFGRCAFNDNQNVGDGTDLNTALLHSTLTDAFSESDSTTTPISVDGGSFDYKTANGGHIDTYSNKCRISIGAGSGTSISDKLNSASSLCVEGWYMYDGSGRDVLVSRFGSGFSNQFNHIVDPGGQFHYNSTGTGLGGANVDWDAFGDNVWFHSIWQHGANSHRWWINGVEVGTVVAAGSTDNVSSSCGFSIASRSDRYEDLGGKVAIVRIYNRLLTNTEISTHYNTEKARFGL